MTAGWDERAAAEAQKAWGARFGSDVAELCAATRLLGADPALVLHGGGNTSLERDGVDALGRTRRELWVKASGRDMASITPDGFAVLDLARLAALEPAETLADEALQDLLAGARLSSRAPLPSVETLLHAYVRHPAIVHTHAEDVLVLAAQPEGPALVRETLGAAFAVLPYVRPGQGLARAAAAALREHPGLAGVVFAHHGIFTFGATPREATARMLAAVAACRARAAELAARRPEPSPAVPDPGDAAADALAARWAPLVRGALAAPSGDDDRPHRRVVLDFRGGAALRAAIADGPALELAGRGVLTADHLIRTRHKPLVFVPREGEGDDEAGARLRREASVWTAEYLGYVERHGGADLLPGDETPRVVLIPGAGLFGAGPTGRDAAAAADIAERSLAARRLAERLGRFVPLPEKDQFEIEFWPPERAKLRRAPRAPLAGRVALVTGAAGAIGLGVARALAREGARVVLADRPGPEHETRLVHAAARVAEAVGPAAVSWCAFDVTDPADVERAFAAIARTTGGADLLVLSHGAALVGEIAALPPERVEGIFAINTFGAFSVLGAFVRQVKAQGTGGDAVLISTKNVPDPGASFAAYSASKAAAHQLARVAALELAPLDVRVNMVSPDAVFGDAANPSLLWQEVGAERARSRGIDPATLPEQYRQRNLLKSRVTAEHVAAAVLFFATRATPTTGAVLPVDGGLPGAFPR